MPSAGTNGTSIVNTSTNVQSTPSSAGDGQDHALVTEMERLISSYKSRPMEMCALGLLRVLERFCSLLCFADEEFIRNVDLDRYGRVLESVFAVSVNTGDSALLAQSVQALALFADLVPRGALAIAAVKGVPPLLRLVKETKVAGNETMLEELLKCLSNVSLEAHNSMVRENAVMVLAQFETRAENHHLQMLCLRCLSNLLESARMDEWSTYLSKPCHFLVARFREQATALLGHKAEERLSRESETYFLRLLECVTLIFDRLLHSPTVVRKNSSIVEQTVSVLVMILERTGSMGPQCVVLRDGVCSPLLSIFLTDPATALRVFMKHNFLSVLCGVLVAELNGWKTKRLHHNGAALAEALLCNDLNAIPCIAEEQRAIPLLEFLLVIIPAVQGARERDWYITLPHFSWLWEDDFHNKADCNELLNKKLECEYQRQRASVQFSTYDISHGTRILHVDFKHQQYISGDRGSYPHSIHRNSTLSGFVHRRIMRCCCEETSGPFTTPSDSGSGFSLAANNDTYSASKRQNTLAVAPATEAVATSSPQQSHDIGEENMPQSAANNTGTPEGSNLASSSAQNTTQSNIEAVNGRVVNESGCCCVESYMKWIRREGCNGDANTRGFPGKRGKHPIRDIVQDVREKMLRNFSTRSQFMHPQVLDALVSLCIPTLVTVIKRTVSPVIARHCSILMHRCIDLVAEYMRMERKGHRDTVRELRSKLADLSPNLGSMLTYLCVAIGSSGSYFVPTHPFREYHDNLLTQQLLSDLEVAPSSRLPTPSLLCEAQMSAFCTFLLLRLSIHSSVSLLTDSQQFVMCRHIESIVGPLNKNQKLLRSAAYGSVGVLLCPFHATAEQMEEINLMLLKQVGITLRLEADQTLRHCISSRGTFSSSSRKDVNRGNMNEIYVQKGYENPLEEMPRKIPNVSSKKNMINELLQFASLYKNQVRSVQLVLALSHYLKEGYRDMVSLVHDIPEFLYSLGGDLSDRVTRSSLNGTAKEAFVYLAESLARVIDEHTGLVNLEEISVIERQPARFSRRFRRSRAVLTMADRLWTPLRIKLESVRMEGVDSCSERKTTPLREITINGKCYTILDVKVDRGSFLVVPMSPLSYLAKYILSQLEYFPSETDWGHIPTLRRRDGRRHTLSDGSAITRLFPFSGMNFPILGNSPMLQDLPQQSQEEAADDEESRSLSSAWNRNTASLTVPHPRAGSLQVTNTVPTIDLIEEADEESVEEGGLDSSVTEAERILGVVRALLPRAITRWHDYDAALRDEKDLPCMNDPLEAISMDNIIFICNGEPITNLSLSILELCFNAPYAREVIDSIGSSSRCADTDEAVLNPSKLVQRVHSLWTTMHTIQFAVLSEPLERVKSEKSYLDYQTSERTIRSDESIDSDGLRNTSPRHVFSKLVRKEEHPLRSAARLLGALKRILEDNHVTVCHDDRRLCGALIYNFYNHLSALMLPPLTLPVLQASLSGSRDSHLASYILWNYPHVFGFEIRRTLLQLLLSARRVPTPSLGKLRGTMHRTGQEISVHGLGWLTPNINLRSTKKVRVQREEVLHSGTNVLRTQAMCPLPLSVQFDKENGVGVGPAMEFYNLLARELQSATLQMWQTEEFEDINGNLSRRIRLPLFPAVQQSSESLSYFEVLGLLVGRVLMEERVVDLPLHSAFLNGILGDLDSNTLCDIDSQLDNQLNRFSLMKEEELASCKLPFILPYDGRQTIELCPDGDNVMVTKSNLKNYLLAVRKYYCQSVLRNPLVHFTIGLRYAVLPEHLKMFDADELRLLINGPEGKIWEQREDFERVIIPSHGYNAHSPVVKYLLDVVSAWNALQQRAFLRFVTGSNRIPLGGLQPPITVVRRSLGILGENIAHGAVTKDSFANEDSVNVQQLIDGSLPTVNTCVHYLKLPSYSSKAILETKLQTAVLEGQESFHLT